MIHALVAAVAVLAFPTVALADVLEVQPVTDDVWAIVGPLEQRSPENLANNATFGLVVTPEGAVLMDPGGSWQGAELLNEKLFLSLSHARATLQAWRNDYNLNRPHSGLGWLTPTEYADGLNQGRDLPLPSLASSASDPVNNPGHIGQTSRQSLRQTG